MCVSSSSGAMGKASKPVAAVASVAIGPYCSQCLMSHLWVISSQVLCPVTLQCTCQNNGVNVWCVTWS